MKSDFNKIESLDYAVRPLDINKVLFDENGVIDFYWPLDNKESAELMNFLTEKVIPYVTNNEKELHELTSIRLLYKWFLCEVLSQFESTILVCNFKKDNVTPIIPKHYKKINALYRSNSLKCSFFLNLSSGPSFGRKIPYLVKRVGKEFLWNGFDSKLIYRYGTNSNDILAIEPSNLTIQHAKGAKKLLRYSSFNEWFGSMPQNYILRNSEVKAGLEKIISIVQDGFRARGYEMSPDVYEYLSSWLIQANNFTHYHLNDQNDLIDNIKDEVWFGCGGNTVWHVMLIEKLRQKNIKVLTHDHGSGNSHHEQTPVHWVEFLHTDHFVTFNDVNEEVRRSALKKELIFNKKLPIIESLDSVLGNPKRDNVTQSFVINGKIKKVMYLGTAFHGEGTRLRPIFHDMTYFDWQVKLLSRLKKNKVDLIYKPHPEGSSSVPHDFAESFGFQSTTKKFEEIDENVDAYIIDFIFSSTTPKVFKAKKPVFFINLGFPELLPDAIKLIKKSCYYLEAKYSSDSRLSINFKEFDRLINNKEHTFDTSFPDVYFKNV